MDILIFLLVIFGLLGALFYLVGSYFVKYALVPNMGAENRVIENSPAEIGPQTPISVDAKIRKNFDKARTARDQWMQTVQFEKQEVSIQSYDGLTLVGHAILNEVPTDKWMVAVHGYQSNERESTLIAHQFYEAGYNVLTYELRAHGKSAARYIGMGYLDKDDLVAWTNAVVAKYPDSRVFFHGTSMGGATVLFASGLQLPDNVKGIISDCAYTRIWDIFASELKKRFNLGKFPVMYMAQGMAILKAGYNIRQGDVEEYVSKSTLPTLFIHSKADDFIPVSMVFELYDAKLNGVKEMYITENGAHGEAKFVEPKEYYNRVISFAEKYI